MATEQKEVLDLSIFNTVKECEDGEWFDFRYNGAETGIKFLVMGKYADKVTAYETKKTQELARKSSIAEKRKASLELLQELIATERQRGVDDALARVSGISKNGVSMDYDAKVMRQFLEQNPNTVQEILQFSDDLTVFTKAL